MRRKRNADGPSRGRLPAVLAVLACGAAAAWADWPTYRGSAQRTGCVDDQAGPKAPAIQWVYKAQEDYVASPLPEGSAVYFPALGPFNTGLFHCLAAQDNLPRLLWSMQAPAIKRPTVSSPAASEGLLIFGDGMHQTDDAMLHCVMADSGRTVWQYLLPGKLVHLEATPTVDRGRVYTGGGAAGVICLDMKRVLLDGKEMDLAEAQALIAERRKQLTDEATRKGAEVLAYGAEAIEEALPKAAPKLLWQKGKDTWHVDAPVTVADDSVLVASAFLDEEKVGKRALLCLRAASGDPVWELPLETNPWAGVTVFKHVVLAGCSNIRFDIDTIDKAAGEVVAADLSTGRVLWRKKLPGAVLSSIAAKDGLAVFTATDGKLRAWRIETGEEAWSFDARKPFFAGPAVADGMVYAADLAGRLHAVRLADGAVRWTFDVVNAPGAQLPGMVYGSPVVHRGKIYLATCNVQGANAGKPNMVVCVADKQSVERGVSGAMPRVDRQNRSVSLPCRIAPRKLPTLADVYPLEVIACFPAPLGQKAHETVVTTDVKPSDFHAALAELGLRPGVPTRGAPRPEGAEVSIAIEITDAGGQSRVIPIEDVLVEARSGLSMPPLKWYFTGSAQREPAEGAASVYAADLGGTLITLFPVTDETVIQSSLSMKPRAVLRLDTDRSILPPEGTDARLIISAGPARAPAVPHASLAEPGPFAPPPFRYREPHPTGLAVLLPAPLRWQLPDPALRSGARPVPLAFVAIRPSQVPEQGVTPLVYASAPPPPRRLSAGDLARAGAADPGLPPDLPAVPRADADRLNGGSDILAADPRASAVPGKTPLMREAPLTYERQNIPEPSSVAGAMRLAAPLSDDGTPVPFVPTPARAALPVKK